jgi:Domain of unknown function (DUF3490)
VGAGDLLCVAASRKAARSTQKTAPRRLDQGRPSLTGSSSDIGRGVCRDIRNDQDALRRTSVELHRERQWLAARLKQVYSEVERNELFRKWNITQIKERKKALSLRLWDPQVRNSPA